MVRAGWDARGVHVRYACRSSSLLHSTEGRLSAVRDESVRALRTFDDDRLGTRIARSARIRFVTLTRGRHATATSPSVTPDHTHVNAR